MREKAAVVASARFIQAFSSVRLVGNHILFCPRSCALVCAINHQMDRKMLVCLFAAIIFNPAVRDKHKGACAVCNLMIALLRNYVFHGDAVNSNAAFINGGAAINLTLPHLQTVAK
jgi:hypothetical protein